MYFVQKSNLRKNSHEHLAACWHSIIQVILNQVINKIESLTEFESQL